MFTKANLYNTLLFFTICACLILDIVGLPIPKQQEPDTVDGLLAGKDFLQVLLDLPTTKTHLDTTSHSITSPTSIELEDYPRHLPIFRKSRSTVKNPEKKEDVRKVINVKISSKESRIYLRKNRIVTTTTTSTTTTTTEKNLIEEEIPILQEERESIIAEANRHEFNVEEMEPITRDAEPGYTEELPANVKSIPVIKKLSDFEKTSELLKELSQEKLKDKLQPFHHTVIYHDNNNNHNNNHNNNNNRRGESNLPRSVSYSAVVQNVQNDHWKNPDTTQSTISSEKMEFQTESWNNNPIIYGQPEQNYEIDEAVSVQTNGRTHGVQPTVQQQQQDQENDKPSSSKSKIGYVIEGRKERRYRVEERTPDGFIVGEFGIVNHDDGLLRGVRYTAEETINPKLIYATLMKFLSL
ncbi:nuclear transcription factor Y subunit gamma [Onthophagus taurus]|uniref:nuclear transcription factor Y subunit gamma n=1 Tax=Onthophagus taurus TaxID=166361 RepID=UPI0039BDBBA5